MLQRYFRLQEQGTTVRTEFFAGVTTFLTMAYIIFVQPAVLSGAMFGMNTGMDFGVNVSCVTPYDSQNALTSSPRTALRVPAVFRNACAFARRVKVPVFFITTRY